MPRKLIPLAIALVLALAVAGCGGDDDGGDNTAATQTNQQTTPAGGGGGATNVTVAMSEYQFEPSDVTIRSGGTITVRNEGQISHDLTVEQGPNASEETKKLAGTPNFLPSKSEKLTVDLKPGKYVIVCRVPGHREQGMTGTLTVK